MYKYLEDNYNYSTYLALNILRTKGMFARTNTKLNQLIVFSDIQKTLLFRPSKSLCDWEDNMTREPITKLCINITFMENYTIHIESSGENSEQDEGK